jgi:hypothetical protein
MPDVISKYIEIEKWNSVPESQQNYLLSIGFEPRKKTSAKVLNSVTERLKAQVQSTAPEPYFLTLNTVCSLCLSSTITHGAMVLPYEKSLYLKFVPAEGLILPDNAKKDFKRKEIPTCSCCQEKLKEKTSEELILMLIKKHNCEDKYNQLLQHDELPEWKLEIKEVKEV